MVDEPGTVRKRRAQGRVEVSAGRSVARNHGAWPGTAGELADPIRAGRRRLSGCGTRRTPGGRSPAVRPERRRVLVRTGAVHGGRSRGVGHATGDRCAARRLGNISICRRRAVPDDAATCGSDSSPRERRTRGRSREGGRSRCVAGPTGGSRCIGVGPAADDRSRIGRVARGLALSRTPGASGRIVRAGDRSL